MERLLNTRQIKVRMLLQKTKEIAMTMNNYQDDIYYKMHCLELILLQILTALHYALYKVLYQRYSHIQCIKELFKPRVRFFNLNHVD